MGAKPPYQIKGGRAGQIKNEQKNYLYKLKGLLLNAKMNYIRKPLELKKSRRDGD
jgi:hypothetical protein